MVTFWFQMDKCQHQNTISTAVTKWHSHCQAKHPMSTEMDGDLDAAVLEGLKVSERMKPYFLYKEHSAGFISQCAKDSRVVCANWYLPSVCWQGSRGLWILLLIFTLTTMERSLVSWKLLQKHSALQHEHWQCPPLPCFYLW